MDRLIARFDDSITDTKPKPEIPQIPSKPNTDSKKKEKLVAVTILKMTKAPWCFNS